MYGRSHQDKQLSLKGWEFGQGLKQGKISTSTEAVWWLDDNLRAKAFY